MEKKKIRWNEFLKYFIKEEKFRQNALLKTNDFIKFCGERDVRTSKEELEFFEKEGLFYPVARINIPVEEHERIKFKKDGKEFWRPAGFGLQEGEVEIEKYKVKRYSEQGIREGYKEDLIELLENEDLFHPSERPFQAWKNFKGEKLENGSDKIEGFYSSFQIYALEKIKKNSFVKFSFAHTRFSLDELEANKSDGQKCGPVFYKIRMDYEVTNRENLFFNDEQYERHLKLRLEMLKRCLDWETQKKNLIERCKEFDNFIMFLLTVQSVYIPHMKSGSRAIQLSNIEDKEWQDLKSRFDLDKELSLLGVSIDEVCCWYVSLCREAEYLLGSFSNDWAQLYKNISWDKKDKIEGAMRLGVDYLQWAVMIKRIFEEYLKRRIFDIDEVKNFHSEAILKINPCDRDSKKLPMLRKYRNDNFYDKKEDKDYYYDRYKRLFYLCNSFGIDYQPRVMLFVEGDTEEKVLPLLFEWYSGISPGDMGIEIINFRGVGQLLSTSESAEKLRNLLIDLQRQERQKVLSKSKNTQLNQIIKDLKEIDIVISNWTSFLSYNLEKWQIIPFFFSDDEGNIRHFLESEKPIKFEGGNYNVPKRWRFLWGVDNDNVPFKGKDFEFANFSNEEIVAALRKIIDKKITIEEIQTIRESGFGINKVDGADKKKVEIGKELVQTLIATYKATKDDAILKRPIISAIDKVLELASLNHLPTSRSHELTNKTTIKKWLSE